ncbi:hypothetical protein [Sphingobium sp.]|nr:hypothetical protein [Sphingobium sp.]HUD91102.1 hypothetical protein [Sphingobium sp.]
MESTTIKTYKIAASKENPQYLVETKASAPFTPWPNDLQVAGLLEGL